LAGAGVKTGSKAAGAGTETGAGASAEGAGTLAKVDTGAGAKSGLCAEVKTGSKETGA